MHALSSIFEIARCPERPGFALRILPAGHPALGKGNMPNSAQQLLHLVLGGELTGLESTTFKDLHKVEVVGVFPNYATAYAAWKAKAQKTVDNAHMRYFIVHLHRLLDPGHDTKPAR
jgi:hypothetical protein